MEKEELQQAAPAAPSGEMLGLMHAADALDGEAAANTPAALMEAQEEAQVASLAQTNSQGVMMVMETALPFLCKLYPSLAGIYDDDAKAAIAGTVGPVLAKYNVDLSAVGGAYREEIACLFVCGPIAWATVEGIKADIAARARPATLAAPKPATFAPSAPVKVTLKPGDYGYKEPEEAAIPA